MQTKKMGKSLLSYYTNLPFNEPQMINIGLTHACNFNCNICNTRIDDPKQEERIGIETIKKVIKDISNWSENIGISFAGGEPLTRKEDVLESIKFAKENNLTTYMTTNCNFLDDETSKRIVDSGLDFISLSLDGYKKETNDYIRDKGSHKSVLSAIDNLKKWKNKTDTNIKIGLTTIITAKNLDELIKIHEFAKKKELHEINYNPYVPDNSFMGKINYDNDEFWVKGDDLKKLRNVIDKLLKIKKSEKGIIGTSEFILENTYDYFEQKDRFERGKCLAGQSYMYIKPNGNVDVCGKGPSFNIRPMNVKEMSIKKIWCSLNFFITRLKVKICDEPCLMVCFPKVNVKNFLRKVTR